MGWECPERGMKGEATIISKPPIGEVMSVITAVATDHRHLSPDCPVSKRPAGYVRIILHSSAEEMREVSLIVKEKKE